MVNRIDIDATTVTDDRSPAPMTDIRLLRGHDVEIVIALPSAFSLYGAKVGVEFGISRGECSPYTFLLPVTKGIQTVTARMAHDVSRALPRFAYWSCWVTGGGGSVCVARGHLRLANDPLE